VNNQPSHKPNLMNPYRSDYPRNRDSTDITPMAAKNTNMKGSTDPSNDHLSSRDNTIKTSTSV
jgi:hypothetical protein